MPKLPLYAFAMAISLLSSAAPVQAQVILPGGASTVNLQTGYAGQNQFLLPSGQTITTGGSGVVGDNSQNWLFTNQGDIEAGNSAGGSGLELGAVSPGAAVVTNYGRISSIWNGGNGPSGVRFTNGGQVFNRAGAYIEGYDGLHSDHGSLVVENAGTIHGRSGGGTAIYSGQGLQVTNLAGGTITGEHYGLSANSWNRNAAIFNYGDINTKDQAIKLYDGEVYAVYNAPGALITSGGGSTIDIEGSTGYLLNEGLIEAKNTALRVNNIGTENVYVNAGVMTAGNGYGIQTEDKGNTIYNLGSITGTDGAILIQGNDTRLVLGQHAFLPQLNRLVTGPGSQLDGGAESSGQGNTILLTDIGFEDDELKGFQGFTMNGLVWELTHTLTVSKSLTVERGRLRLADDLVVSDSGGRLVLGGGGTLALGKRAQAETISSAPASTLVFEARLGNDILASDSFIQGDNITLGGRLVAEVLLLNGNTPGQASNILLVGRADQNLDLTGADLSGRRLLYEYQFTRDGEDLNLQITPRQFSFAPLGGPPNTRRMNASLEVALRAGSLPESGPLRELLETAAASGSRTEALALLNAANGTVLSAGPELSRQAARYTRDWALGRALVRPDQGFAAPASGACEEPVWNLQAEGGGAWGRLDGQDGDADYDLRARQAALALDRRFDQFLIGLALTLGHGELDWTSGAETSADSVAGALYGRLDSGPWSLGAAFHLGRSELDSRRRPTADLTAKADYVSRWTGFSLVGAYDWRGQGWEITPRLAAHYLNLHTPAVNERGAGDLSLALAENHSDSLELEAAVKLARPVCWGSTTIVPYLDLGLSVETLDPKTAYTTAFLNAPGVPSFISESPENIGRTTLAAGAGLDFGLGGNTSAYLDYRGRFREHWQEHQGTAGLKVSW